MNSPASESGKVVESIANRCGARAFTLDRVVESKPCSGALSFTLDQVVKSKKASHINALTLLWTIWRCLTGTLH